MLQVVWAIQVVLLYGLLVNKIVFKKPVFVGLTDLFLPLYLQGFFLFLLTYKFGYFRNKYYIC